MEGGATYTHGTFFILGLGNNDFATPRLCLCEACEREPRNTEFKADGVRNVLTCNNSFDDVDDTSDSILSCINDMFVRCDISLVE